MTTSGVITNDFNIAEIIEDAYQRAGYDEQALNGGHMRSARRSLNLILSDWLNKGIKTWAIDDETFTVTDGTAQYTLTAGTIDVMAAYIRRDGADVMLTRISVEDHAAIPEKSTEGKPDRFWLKRQDPSPIMTLYPVPENSTDTVTYWRIRRLYDVTASQETADIPYRFSKALVSALAVDLFTKRAPEQPIVLPNGQVKARSFDSAKYLMLKSQADEAFEAAVTEDRDRTSTTILPNFWNL